MNTLLIDTTVSQQVKKEIELPHFCKYSEWHFFKVTEDEKFISVHVGSRTEVQIGWINEGMIAMSQPCTEQEFNEAFDKAFEIISQLKTVEAE